MDKILRLTLRVNVSERTPRALTFLLNGSIASGTILLRVA
jgi:hypothetical protein